MDFVTEHVCVYAVYTYLYQYSLTLVYMNKSTNDSVTITDQINVCILVLTSFLEKDFACYILEKKSLHKYIYKSWEIT